MASRHDILTISSDEIKCLSEDVKILSIKPSGIVGIQAVHTGTMIMTCLGSEANWAYKIYRLGAIYFIQFSQFGATLVTGTGAVTTKAGSEIPLAFRPSTSLTQPLGLSVAQVGVLGCVNLRPEGTIFVRPLDSDKMMVDFNAITPIPLSVDSFVLSYIKN
jgi:hypothetical protein